MKINTLATRAKFEMRGHQTWLRSPRDSLTFDVSSQYPQYAEQPSS